MFLYKRQGFAYNFLVAWLLWWHTQACYPKLRCHLTAKFRCNFLTVLNLSVLFFALECRYTVISLQNVFRRERLAVRPSMTLLLWCHWRLRIFWLQAPSGRFRRIPSSGRNHYSQIDAAIHVHRHASLAAIRENYLASENRKFWKFLKSLDARTKKAKTNLLAWCVRFNQNPWRW